MPIDVTGFIKKVTKVKKCFCRWDKNDKISFQGGEEVDVVESHNLNVIIFLRCFTNPNKLIPDGYVRAGLITDGRGVWP